MTRAIEADHLGKHYRLGSGERYGRLTDVLSGFRQRRRERPTSAFWALRDVSFTVEEGGVVGIIGRNGAGKSTLLKILSRITEPTEGEARVRGRLGSLLEVGTGFHPELTGRENIYLSGSVLGMRRAEIRRRFDEIVAFAEIDTFLDTPVKRYSSGMQVRLGFAVAAHLEPENLVIDEVLAVGDAAFQRKCLAKMQEVSRGGRTILFVSHNMAAVEHLCSRAILLDRGSVVADGPASSVIDGYLRASVEQPRVSLAAHTDREGNGILRFTGLNAELRTGHDGEIKLSYQADAELRALEINVALFSLRGEPVTFLSNRLSGDELEVTKGIGTVTCRLPACSILPGRYTVNIFCTTNGVVADWLRNVDGLDVLEGDYFGTGRLPPAGYGTVTMPHRWAANDA